MSIPNDLTGTREDDAAREARDVATEAATYADADPQLGPDEHEAALQTEADGLDDIAREEAETLPRAQLVEDGTIEVPGINLEIHPLAALGFNTAAQQVLQAIHVIESYPVEVYKDLVDVMAQQVARAEAAGNDAATLSDLDAQAAVLEATRRFRKELVKVGESIQARRRLQGLQ